MRRVGIGEILGEGARERAREKVRLRVGGLGGKMGRCWEWGVLSDERGDVRGEFWSWCVDKSPWRAGNL